MTNGCVVCLCVWFHQRWNVMNIQLFILIFFFFIVIYLLERVLCKSAQCVLLFQSFSSVFARGMRTVSTERPNTKYGFRNHNETLHAVSWQRRRHRRKRWVSHQILNYSNVYERVSVYTRIFIATIHLLLLLFLVSIVGVDVYNALSFIGIYTKHIIADTLPVPELETPRTIGAKWNFCSRNKIQKPLTEPREREWETNFGIKILFVSRVLRRTSRTILFWLIRR